MGPITSSPIAVLPRRGWLALFAFVAPVALGAALQGLPRSPRMDDARVAVGLDDVARAHRRWVADHGPGCARTVEHLAPYSVPAGEPDAWGHPLRLTCQRMDSGRLIVVWIESAGPDGRVDTSDDLTGMDVQALAD